MNVHSKIYSTEDGRFYLSTENNNEGDKNSRVYADETIKINFQDRQSNTVVEGRLIGNAWLFKVEEGKSVYIRITFPVRLFTTNVYRRFSWAMG